jgi:hypothetical protein
MLQCGFVRSNFALAIAVPIRTKIKTSNQPLFAKTGAIRAAHPAMAKSGGRARWSG